MALLRRRDRVAPADLPGAVPDQAQLDAVAAAVQDIAASALGTRPAVSEGPAPILTGCGPGAYWLQLATGDARWSGGLCVRVDEPLVLARDAAWLRGARAAGFPVPDLIADPPGGPLVYSQPPGLNLTAQMVKDLAGVSKLLDGLGRLHARLHRMRLDGLDTTAASSAGDPLDELVARTDHPAVREGTANEIEWLRRHRVPGTGPVACHGGFNPLHVYLEEGNFSTASVLNWTRARVGDAEYDVAGTVVGLWSVPLFLDNAMYRKAMKMARDAVVTAYLDGYKASADRPLDDAALRYWQVHHLTALLIDAHRRNNDVLGTSWDVARGVINPEGTIKELHERIRDVASA